MKQAADAYPKGSKARDAFGSIAWGRYEGEPSGADSKENAIFGCAFLQGVRYALLQVSRCGGIPELENEMRRIHDRVDGKP
jgi:hypothetical protein